MVMTNRSKAPRARANQLLYQFINRNSNFLPINRLHEAHKGHVGIIEAARLRRL